MSRSHHKSHRIEWEELKMTSDLCERLTLFFAIIHDNLGIKNARSCALNVMFPFCLINHLNPIQCSLISPFFLYYLFIFVSVCLFLI